MKERFAMNPTPGPSPLHPTGTLRSGEGKKKRWRRMGCFAGVAAAVVCIITLALVTNPEAGERVRATRTAAAVIAAAEATNQALTPSATASATGTATASATITETAMPSATATQSAQQQIIASLTERFAAIEGVESVDVVNVVGSDPPIVYIEAQTARGFDQDMIAVALRDASYAGLLTGALEFSCILNDGSGAGVDYTWSNVTDSWTITRLTSSVPTVTSIPISRSQRRCPANCDEAVAMGLTAQEAAACGLDRDRDGVACYGD